MKFAVVSLMPEMFDAIRNFGVTSRAFERNLVTLTVVNPRTFAEDRHGTVDDRPYGGGPGMVLKAEPMLAAVKAAKAAVGGRPIVVHFSPRGKPLDQGLLASWIEHFDEMVFWPAGMKVWMNGLSSRLSILRFVLGILSSAGANCPR